MRGGAAPPDVALERLRFAAPSRATLPALERYARLESAGGDQLAGYTEASRGCLHHCRHCPIPPVYGGRFFVVPVDVVLADVAAQVAAGARHITLGDPDFLNGPEHALAVARAIHAAHPTVTFDVTVKVEHILRHAERFAELRALGCAFVVSAVESLSDRVLAILDKGHTRADVDRALAILDDAGVPLRPTFVPFTPWSTLDDYLALLDWIDAHGLIEQIDPIQLAIRLLMPPGSLLLEHPETRPYLGALEPARLSCDLDASRRAHGPAGARGLWRRRRRRQLRRRTRARRGGRRAATECRADRAQAGARPAAAALRIVVLLSGADEPPVRRAWEAAVRPRSAAGRAPAAAPPRRRRARSPRAKMKPR